MGSGFSSCDHRHADQRFACFDPERMPAAHQLVDALQDPPDCESARVLEWDGFRGTLTGLGSGLVGVEHAMAAAWASGRSLRLTLSDAPRDSFFLESCGKRNVFECHWAHVCG